MSWARPTFTGSSSSVVETLHICAAGSTGPPHCGDVALSAMELKIETGDGPGADGYAEWYEQELRRDAYIEAGVLDVRLASGDPDEDSSLQPGRYAIHIVD